MSEKLISVIPKYNKRGDLIGFYREVKMDKNLIVCKERLEVIQSEGKLTGDWELLILIRNLFDACVCLEERIEKLSKPGR